MYNYESKVFKKKRMWEVRQGDLLRIVMNERIPIDMLFWSSSDKDGQGMLSQIEINGKKKHIVKQSVSSLV